MDPKPLMMIVDDDVSNIKALESILKEDYRIVPRKSGEQALSYFETLGYSWPGPNAPAQGQQVLANGNNIAARLPGLILLDVVMPGIDGYEVCWRLRKHPQLAKIPVIFLTGKIEASDVTRGFEIGAVDFVAKPFNGVELKARVATHLSPRSVRESLGRTNDQNI